MKTNNNELKRLYDLVVRQITYRVDCLPVALRRWIISILFVLCLLLGILAILTAPVPARADDGKAPKEQVSSFAVKPTTSQVQESNQNLKILEQALKKIRTSMRDVAVKKIEKAKLGLEYLSGFLFVLAFGYIVKNFGISSAKVFEQVLILSFITTFVLSSVSPNFYSHSGLKSVFAGETIDEGIYNLCHDAFTLIADSLFPSVQEELNQWSAGTELRSKSLPI